MTEFASEQERIIHELSQHSLGRPSLFLPDNYGKNANEPADIVWISNRCAILMYMRESMGSVEKKQKHNLSQLNRWLRRWQSGQVLTGRVGPKEYSVAFGDIDHIVGLSIIDGGENNRCEYHAERVTYRLDSKLDVCATVTGKVMRQFALLGYGARDIVRCLGALRLAEDQRASEHQILEVMQIYRDRELNRLSQLFPELIHDADFRDRAIQRTLEFIVCSKHTDDAGVNEMGSDFNIGDVLWFGFANAALGTLVAKPGQHGPLWGRTALQAGIYNLECIMGSTMQELSNYKQLPSDYETGLTLVSALNFGRQNPMMVLFCRARKKQSSYLEQELAAIRAATFAQSSNPKT